MFRVYRDDKGHWCACRDDGLVGGLFCDRAEAERFARSEERLAESLARDAGGLGATGPSTGSTAMESLAGKVSSNASSSRLSIRVTDFRSLPLMRQG